MSEDNDQSSPKELRDALERAQAEAAEGAAAKRELAFLKAGVDVSTPTGKLFAKAYDGEMDADAVKAQAIEFGVITEDDGTPPPPTPQIIVPGQTNETRDRQLLNAGSVGSTADLLSNLDAAYAERQKLRSEGASDEKAAAPVLGAILAQAQAGNPLFVYDENRWNEQVATQA